jgi:hypothetical protein
VGGAFTLMNLGTGSPSNDIQATPTNLTGTGLSSVTYNTGSNPASGEYAGNCTTSCSSGVSSPFGTQGGSQSNYLAAGGINNSMAGLVTVTFSSAQTSLNLLWGTLDETDSRNFIIVDGITITGSTVGTTYAATTEPFGTITNSSDDVGVEITNLPTSFTTVTFGDSDQSAFEFELGQPSTTATPLPAALPLFAGGLGMIGLLGRRRKRKQVA